MPSQGVMTCEQASYKTVGLSPANLQEVGGRGVFNCNRIPDGKFPKRKGYEDFNTQNSHINSRECVYCAVGAESLHAIQISLGLYSVNKNRSRRPK